MIQVSGPTPEDPSNVQHGASAGLPAGDRHSVWLHREAMGAQAAGGKPSAWCVIPSSGRADIGAKRAGLALPSSCLANVYIDHTFARVVVSEHTAVRDHGALHGALVDYLRTHTEQAAGASIEMLPDHQVAAFVDGPNILVRIEDSRLYFNRITEAALNGEDILGARQNLFRAVARYRRAVNIALDAAHERGGDVFLLAGGFSESDSAARLNIAKILGEAHRVHQNEASSGAQFIASHIVETDWGRYYYRKEQGTRYLSVDHFVALAEHVDTRSKFVEGTQKLSDWLHARNKQGAREAVLLLIDDTGSALMKDSAVERAVKEKIQSIAELASETPHHRWRQVVPKLEQLFAEAVQTFRAGTHTDFVRDDPHNPRYVEVVSNILRGQTSKVSLGAGFSTPLKAVDVGRFVRSTNGSKVFQTSAVDGLQREIVKWICANKDLLRTRADWVCLFEPLIAFTPTDHAAKEARALLPQDERNFVVLTGIAGGEELKLVIRENPYSEAHWDSIDFARLRGLQMPSPSRKLAAAAVDAMQTQFSLINGLWSALDVGIGTSLPDSSGSRFAVPPFVPIKLSSERRLGDFFIRPFIDGQRLDLLSRMEMSPQQMEFALHWIGKIMVVNFLAQRPAFSLHELLSVSPPSEQGAATGYIRSIGASESFCNAINVVGVDQAIEKGSLLYGTHLATWVASLRFGAYGDSLPASDEIDSRLIDACLAAFEQAYEQIALCAPETFEPVMQSVMQPVKSKEKLLAVVPELDMSLHLWLTRGLLQISSEERTRFIQSIAIVAHDMCDCLGRVCAYPGGADVASEEERNALRKHRETLIARVYSLVGNHLSGNAFSVVQDALSGKTIDFQAYSLEERNWLLTVLDVELWLTAVGDDAERVPLWCVASDSGTEKRFVDAVRETFCHACLSEKRALEFYEAVHGLEREFGRDAERRQRVEADLFSLCKFLPPWDAQSIH